ncbi:MAG: GldG family protein [Candidatus Syntrophosphaera sp.]|nr:GldG family protein [Candidatus Syntrophosphaera sp.]
MARQGQILGTYTAKIAIAILVLVVGSFLYLRFDASKNKAYSLSAQTKHTLRGMEDRVVVKVFASQDLTPELSNLNRLTKDMLAEFERQSRGRFYYEYVRARSNDDLIDQARENNIQPYMVVTMENDRQVSKAVVLGLSFEGSGRFSSMYLRPGMESMLEYQVLKQVNKIQDRLLPELTVFADSLALMFQYNTNPDETATFFLELMENYRVIHTDLMTAPKFTPVMLCLGVVKDLELEQLYHLDQYIMQGGRVVMAQDRVAVFNTPQGTAVVEIESNLFRLLEHYGVMIKPNIVLDRECEVRRGSGLGTQTPYPFFPLIRPNPNYAYTKGFDNIYFYFASEIVSLPGSQLNFEPVLQSSDRSNTLLGPVFQIEEAINRGLDPGYLNLPPVTVAAEVSGTFRSFFTEALTDSTFHPTSSEARLIIFGDSELPMDFGAGAFIVLNAIDHLLERPDMLKLRSPRKSQNILGVDVFMARQGLNPADPEKTAGNLTTLFKLAAILLPTLLLALLGIILALGRSSRAKA